MAGRVAGQDRRQVEAEAVDVHLLDPVAQAVHDQPPDDRVVGVERVAAAGVVGVPRAAVFEDVVGRVVDAAEAERRPVLIALGGVVEHHVENDLDAGPVQRLDHVAELVHRAERVLARAVRLVRREERDRRVAPVVDLARRTVLGVELEHRQQFDRGDAELLEVRNLLDQAGVGAARLLADAGARMAGEAADVHLVDDGARRRAGAAARRPPSRTRPDRRRRSSSPSRRCRPAASRPRGRSPSERPRRGRTGRAGPWSGSNRSPRSGADGPSTR